MGDCVHHWIVQGDTGSLALAECKHCGIMRNMLNSWEAFLSSKVEEMGYLSWEAEKSFRKKGFYGNRKQQD
jgi:hypothetical protein